MALIFGAPVIEPAGKQASTASMRGEPVGEIGLDRRHQLVHLGVALDGEQARDPHAAESGDAAEVVAHEVDDHQVLGLLLVAGLELGPQIDVLDDRATARTGALDRLRDDVAGRRRPCRNCSGDELSSARSPKRSRPPWCVGLAARSRP